MATPGKSQSLFAPSSTAKSATTQLSSAEREFQMIQRRRSRLVFSVAMPIVAALLVWYFVNRQIEQKKRSANFAQQNTQAVQQMRSQSIDAFRKKVNDLRLEEAKTNMRRAVPQTALPEFSPTGGLALPGFQMDRGVSPVSSR